MLAKPLRIGLYGVSGIGKSYLLDKLNQYVNSVVTLDGSTAIDQVCEGGLSAFKKMQLEDKYNMRCASIAQLNRQFFADNRHMIVSGHYSFLTSTGYEIAWTEADTKFYDLIIILKCSSEKHFQRCNLDHSRNRNFSQEQLDDWREFEHNGLQAICAASAIPFYSLSVEEPLELVLQQLIYLISDEVIAATANDLARQFDSVILCDCDGTLNNDDILNYSINSELSSEKISNIFKHYGDYSPESFFAVSEYVDTLEQKNIVSNMLDNAGVLQPHTLIVNELTSIREKNHTKGINDALVLVSCGFPTGWNHPCLASTLVLGGASFNCFGCILTNERKTKLAKLLRSKSLTVTSLGNSSSDFGMLENSDFAYFIYSNKIKSRYVDFLNKNDSVKLLCLKGV